MKKNFLLTSTILLLIIFFNAYNNSKKSFEGLTNSRQSEIKDVLKKIINESSYFRELLNIWISVYNNDGSIKMDDIITKIKSFGKNYFLMAYTVNELTSSNTFINTIAPKFQEIRSDIMNLQSYLVGKDRDGNIINSFYPSDKFLSDFINTIINTSDININETLTVLDIGSINITEPGPIKFSGSGTESLQDSLVFLLLTVSINENFMGETIISITNFNWNEEDVLDVAAEMVIGHGLHVHSTEIPSVFSLSQNYPNPFNPYTNIRYDIPKDVFLNISIYDMMGKMINNIVNQHQNPGHFSVVWDGKNTNGENVAAGLYIYMIDAGEFRQTKKMILLK